VASAQNELHFEELSLAAQTAYAEILDAARAREVSRSIANLSGAFAQKKVKGRLYWYYQYRDIGGKVRQLYVGPDNPSVRALVKDSKDKADKGIVPQARSALELGCQGVVPKHFRIIRRLSEYGFFRAGGVLVGTHAFLVFGNMLGVRWEKGLRTQDVDLAHAGKKIAIALPATIDVDIHDAIGSLQMGFLPVTAFEGDVAATYLNPKDPELRLDFLTPRGRGRDKPVKLPNLNVVAQPLPFMEFLLESPTQASLLSRDGSILVSVPNAARYAVHKLLVWAERKQAFRAKATKDLWQAAALMSYFKQNQPEDLNAAWNDLCRRGKGWVSRAKRGKTALARIAPELEVNSLLP